MMADRLLKGNRPYKNSGSGRPKPSISDAEPFHFNQSELSKDSNADLPHRVSAGILVHLTQTGKILLAGGRTIGPQ